MHLGVDLSRWQGAVDGPELGLALKQRGGEEGFAIVQLTNGLSANPLAGEQVDSCRSGGLQVAGYHFLDPAIDAGDQIDNVLAHRNGCEVIAVDSELRVGTWGDVAAITRSMLVGLSWHLLDPWLYSNGYFLENMPGAPWGKPLWLADPAAKVASRRCLVWQYDWHGHMPGVETEVDLDLWMGTETQWLGTWGIKV